MPNHRASPLSQRLGIDLSPSFLRLLDAWRAAQPGPLSQAEAVRQLAAVGRSEARKPPPAPVDEEQPA